MARGAGAQDASPPAPALALPKPDYKIIKPTTARPGVNDLQARSYGFNDYDEEYSRPEHYIRYIEPLESELSTQVEYDMDEQDNEWLEMANAERKKEQMDKVSPEVFEVIFDRLEKEWFDLTKNIPKPDFDMPSEDSTCAICDDAEGENSNAIVFCDGCNLAVHQDCYGVPYIPEGQWLCRKCTVSPEMPVSCILCPNEGGAFKQTQDGEWVHLLCAMWVPETRVANEVFMEPITGVESINKQRWKLRCAICQVKQGACIQCAKNSCFAAFHATCARGDKLLMPMKSSSAIDLALTAFCEKHLPEEQAHIREKALAAQDSDEDEDAGEDPSPQRKSQKAKSARAHAKIYHTGPPLVPEIIVQRLLKYINKVKFRKKDEFVLSCCRYWSLKREARRGAPLLKRLHLEPWTASGGLSHSYDVAGMMERRIKLEQLRLLKDDLARLRLLAAGCRKREIKKLKQAMVVPQLLSTGLFAHESRLRGAFEKIMGHDKANLFRRPVTKAEAPDYFDIVKRPMCWEMIDAKLDRHEYWDLQVFKDDVLLVLENSLLYNAPGTPHHRTATRIHKQASDIIAGLASICISHLPKSGHVASTSLPLQPGALDYFEGSQPEPHTKIKPENDLEQPLSSEFVPQQNGFSPPLTTTATTPPPDTPGSVFGPPATPAPSVTPTTTEDTPGNLEPPDSVLEILHSHHFIASDVKFVLPHGQDPISYLADFHFGEMKQQSPFASVSPLPPPTESSAEPVASSDSAALGPMDTDADLPLDKNFGVPEISMMQLEEDIPLSKPSRKDLDAELDASPGFAARKPARALEKHVHIEDVSAPVPQGTLSSPSLTELGSSTDPFGLYLDTNAGLLDPPPVAPALSTPPNRRSQSFVPPTSPSTPAIVHDVDKKGSFTHFETGWVLPEGSRRNNRVSYDERIAIVASTSGPPSSSSSPSTKERGQPPKKKARTGSSKLSKFSTPASENETLGGPLSDASTSNRRSRSKAESIGPFYSDDPPLSTDPDGWTRLPETISVDPDGVPVVEQLDTPATRRRLAMTRKRSQHNTLDAMRQERLAAMDVEGLNEGSDLSDRDDKEDDKLKQEPRSSRSNIRKIDKMVSSPKKTGFSRVDLTRCPEHLAVVPDSKGRVVPGTLVWAKANSFPWWPGTLQDVNDSEVPKELANEAKAKTAGKEKLFCVQFFDSGNTWTLQPSKKLRLFGIDEDHDAKMLTPSAMKNSTGRRSKNLGPLREAYRMAKRAQTGEN